MVIIKIKKIGFSLNLFLIVKKKSRIPRIINEILMYKADNVKVDAK